MALCYAFYHKFGMNKDYQKGVSYDEKYHQHFCSSST